MSRPKLKIPDYVKKQTYDNNIVWVRKCVGCNGNIIHKTLSIAKIAHRNNRKCRKCGCPWAKGLTVETSESLRKMGRKVSAKMKKLRETVPPWNYGLKKETSEIVNQMSKNHTGFKHSEETKRQIGKISENLWKNPEYRKLVIKGVEENRNVEGWRKTMERLGYFTPINEKSEWDRYKQLVWYHTNKNDLTSLKHYHLRGRIEITGSFSLDHKVSISSGFKNKIAPEVIGSKVNLEFIPAKENDSKKTKNSITIDKLLEDYNGIKKNNV